MGGSSQGPAEVETMNMQGHQPARLWFFLAAPSSLQVQRRQEHRSKAGYNRRKNRAKAHDICKNVVEMMDHGAPMPNKKEKAERGEKTGNKKKKKRFGMRT